jgi:hypothetical protein
MDIEEDWLFPRAEATVNAELDAAIDRSVATYASRRDFSAWSLVVAALEERWPG